MARSTKSSSTASTSTSKRPRRVDWCIWSWGCRKSRSRTSGWRSGRGQRLLPRMAARLSYGRAARPTACRSCSPIPRSSLSARSVGAAMSATWPDRIAMCCIDWPTAPNTLRSVPQATGRPQTSTAFSRTAESKASVTWGHPESAMRPTPRAVSSPATGCGRRFTRASRCACTFN